MRKIITQLGHVKPYVNNYMTDCDEPIKNNILTTPTVKINVKTIKNDVFIGPTDVHKEKNIKNNVNIGTTDGFTESTSKTN